MRLCFWIGVLAALPIAAAGASCTLSRAGADTGGTGGAASSSTTAGPTTSSSGGKPTGGGGGGSSGTGGAGGAPVSSSSAAPASSSSSGGGVIVDCDNKPCKPGEVCCHDETPKDDKCGPPGSCGNDAELSCEGPADCRNGMICCGVGDLMDWSKVSCEAKCDGFVFCGKGGSCAPPTVCTPSMLLGAGYYICFDPNML